ncbi:MAG TPA: type III-A CRISPR-associated RAMP protein Csm5 [bacterium]|nr:type III-A CRISPR-associated RAMP protein Csm5 [bacterium]HOL35109.1 type III-A CRISPR-associated RAMP protein Csm5 [bacterium]HPP08370.1 type III-A CRISPR-associated RAMP protein Csm5 [bacterium]
MKFKIIVLTPVHIGSGNAISPLEYFINDNKFCRIDMDGLFQDPAFKPQMNYFIENAQFKRRAEEILHRDLYLRHILYEIDIHESARNANLIEVKEFVKSAGRVFIPGSSLKGSILSGVMYGVLKEKSVSNLYDFKGLLATTLNEISGNNKGAFSQWIDISDTEMKSCKQSLMLAQARVMGAKTNRALPVLYEILKPGIQFETEITWHGKKSLQNPETTVLSLADEFYRKIYEKEKKSSVKTIPEVPRNTFLLRVGQGSSAWATSFLLLANESGIANYEINRPKSHKVKGPPTTKKLISGTISMGWIAISKI